jgi:hypothetical protein
MKHASAFAVRPGVELLKRGNTNAELELDFIFVSKQRLHGGECKVGSVLMDKDYETARKAQELGFQEFSFCTVRRFDSETKARILARPRRMDVRVLEGQELLGGYMT